MQDSAVGDWDRASSLDMQNIEVVVSIALGVLQQRSDSVASVLRLVRLFVRWPVGLSILSVECIEGFSGQGCKVSILCARVSRLAAFVELLHSKMPGGPED